ARPRSDVHPRSRDRRCLRGAVQVPAGAERGGAATARLPVAAGVRGDCEISLVMPFGTPVPPSPDTSAALLAAFSERGIEFVPGRRVSSLDTGRGLVALDDGSELPYDLFLGVPKHRAPDVVLERGMAEGGYVP